MCFLAYLSDVAAAVVARGYAEQLVDLHLPILLGLGFDSVFVVLQREKEIPCRIAIPLPSANLRYPGWQYCIGSRCESLTYDGSRGVAG